MEKVTYKGPILIFNNFDEGSKLLYSSLLKAGFSGKAVIINDDGFLDDNLISIYKAFYDKKIMTLKANHVILIELLNLTIGK